MILLVSLIGTGAELLLLGHIETGLQAIPVIVIVAGLMATAWNVASGSLLSRRVFEVLMMVFILAGVGGIFLHYQSNVEFESEMYPSIAGWELFSKSMTGAIPALSPGTMVQIGLLGLAYTLAVRQSQGEK